MIAELATLSSLFISLLLSSSVALVVVAVAWIRYRPIYAMAVLIGAFVPFLIPKLFTPKQRMTDWIIIPVCICSYFHDVIARWFEQLVQILNKNLVVTAHAHKIMCNISGKDRFIRYRYTGCLAKNRLRSVAITSLEGSDQECRSFFYPLTRTILSKRR